MKSRVLFAALLVATAPVSAALYKSIDEDGNVVYSDQPSEGSEEIELQPVNVMDSIDVPRSSPSSAGSASETAGGDAEGEPLTYEIAIIQPEADAAIRENTGNIAVSVSLSPPLREGHKLWYSLDGDPVMSSTSTSAVLQNVDRGTHTITVSVVDAADKPIKTSAGITITVLRYSALNPAVRPNPAISFPSSAVSRP